MRKNFLADVQSGVFGKNDLKRREIVTRKTVRNGIIDAKKYSLAILKNI